MRFFVFSFFVLTNIASATHIDLPNNIKTEGGVHFRSGWNTDGNIRLDFGLPRGGSFRFSSAWEEEKFCLGAVPLEPLTDPEISIDIPGYKSFFVGTESTLLDMEGNSQNLPFPLSLPGTISLGSTQESQFSMHLDKQYSDDPYDSAIDSLIFCVSPNQGIKLRNLQWTSPHSLRFDYEMHESGSVDPRVLVSLRASFPFQEPLEE